MKVLIKAQIRKNVVSRAKEQYYILRVQLPHHQLDLQVNNPLIGGVDLTLLTFNRGHEFKNSNTDLIIHMMH